ncbi:MAG: DNA polymerase III subunit gamma/tau [Candidatus Yanofskybacteria bacterium]|nr:DNA polymerase III subunit gamma/tau [Candidatus Yanofskybacteria bacterium]
MLYRTYRPTTWSEVVGQEHVVRTLQGALETERIGHAYLFAGPRGTGKTTLGRLFAKALNCTAKSRKPCGSCDSCVSIEEGRSMDLIEIDAASNRTIDDMRELRENIGAAPTASKYKVYLIDEAHMITKEAFNAFLKTLEEPPAHVIFILATTDAAKIIPTVLSRVQRFDFKKPTQQQIVTKLATVAKQEKLKISDGALAAVAAAADGAFRDAEVMLTKLASHLGGSAIDEAIAQSVLGLVPLSWHPKFLTALAARDRAGALRFLHEIQAQGADADQFAKGFLEYLRRVMVAKIDMSILEQAGLAMADTQLAHVREFAANMEGAQLVKAIQAFTDARNRIRTAPIAFFPLELAALEVAAP